MISQKQKNIRGAEQEAAPPLEQKQTPMRVSFWRGRSLWLRIGGVAVPLVVGFAFFAYANYLNLPRPEYLFLVGVVSAGLLRSWWAMLIVPVAVGGGILLSSIFHVGGFDLQNWAASGFWGVDLLMIFGGVPNVIGAALGTFFGKEVEQRLYH